MTLIEILTLIALCFNSFKIGYKIGKDVEKRNKNNRHPGK